MSLDDISDGSTTISSVSNGGVRGGSVKSINFNSVDTVVSSSGLMGSRMNEDVMMDSVIVGHKDSKNTYLTVASGDVHTVRTSSQSNLDYNAMRQGIPLGVLNGSRKHRRVGGSYQAYGSANIGAGMRDTVMLLDSERPDNAMPVVNFAVGGQGSGRDEDDTFIAAGNSLPATGPSGKSLNTAAGLHYSAATPPFTDNAKTAKENFMKSKETKQAYV